VESMGIDKDFWKDKVIFITGHTGFKGGWLSIWLKKLGADVHGYSLAPPTLPSLYKEAKIEEYIDSSIIGNICEYDNLYSEIQKVNPQIVIHMAAQPLVRESYVSPINTYATNVMGTVNILEAVRNTPSVKAMVNITTDKCYKNKDWVWPYRENDELGGHDPYSSSKACAELVASSYSDSFFLGGGVYSASVRAGNVIGGGDWANDRLIPDAIRALYSDKELSIRSPVAIRPWQHVLEPLQGYILLAERLYNDKDMFVGAWNFGPSDSSNKSVEWIVNYISMRYPEFRLNIDTGQQLHEANILKLDSSKSKNTLKWHSKLNLSLALDWTLDWYDANNKDENMLDFCLEQIDKYEEL
jgi:CDP-glucose 4,6-dehydratase